MLHHKSDPWGTLREDHTSRLPHLGFFSSHLTAITSENLFSSFFSFTFIPKILLSFISSQLTTWFCHNSQKTSMPPVHPCMFYERVIAFVNLTIVTMISKVLNLHNGICMIEEVVPTDTNGYTTPYSGWAIWSGNYISLWNGSHDYLWA